MYRATYRAERSLRDLDTLRPVAGSSGSLAAHISQVEGAPGPDQGPSRAAAWLMGLAGALVVVVVGAGAFMNAQRGVPSSRASAIAAQVAAKPRVAPIAAAPVAAAPVAAAPIAAAPIPTINVEPVEDPPVAAKKKSRKRIVRGPVAASGTPAPDTTSAPTTATAPAPASAPKTPTSTSAAAAAKIKAQEDLIRASAETPIN